MALHARSVGQDVRELAGLLGEVFAEQTSPAALETVEALRTAAIDYREGELDSRATLQSTLADCSAARETVVPRAFTAYFELINLAEERQRVRAIRTATEAEALEHGLDEAAEALARSDMEIAAEYARIADPELRDRFLPRLQDAHARAVELTLDVADRDRLIQKDWLAECLRRRNPYVDPLNLLQVRLLEREDRTAREEQTLRLTVKGIAAGMKNTG